MGPLEQEEQQDLHRQLLNLPLHSSGGSHDSHNDSGYSTRLGASAGPSPSLSGSRPGSTDGENQQVGQTGQQQQQQGSSSGGRHGAGKRRWAKNKSAPTPIED